MVISTLGSLSPSPLKLTGTSSGSWFLHIFNLFFQSSPDGEVQNILCSCMFVKLLFVLVIEITIFPPASS